MSPTFSLDIFIAVEAGETLKDIETTLRHFEATLEGCSERAHLMVLISEGTSEARAQADKVVNDINCAQIEIVSITASDWHETYCTARAHFSQSGREWFAFFAFGLTPDPDWLAEIQKAASLWPDRAAFFGPVDNDCKQTSGIYDGISYGEEATVLWQGNHVVKAPLLQLGPLGADHATFIPFAHVRDHTSTKTIRHLQHLSVHDPQIEQNSKRLRNEPLKIWISVALKGFNFGWKALEETGFYIVRGRWRTAHVARERLRLTRAWAAGLATLSPQLQLRKLPSAYLPVAAHACRPSKKRGKISIVMCTHNRPELFKRAMRSLSMMIPCRDHDVDVIVVENEQHPKVQQWLAAQAWPWPVIHVLETKQGLAHARNRGLDVADARGSQWVASFDDDQEADPAWLLEYERAIASYPTARAFTGPYVFRYPKGLSAFRHRTEMSGYRLGQPMTIAATGNALFHRDLFGAEAARLRFDNRFNKTGGEDTAFSKSVLKMGQKIHWVPSAKISEDVDRDRTTLQYLARRTTRNALNASVIRRINYGTAQGLLRDIIQIYRSIILTLLAVLCALMFLPFYPKRAKAHLGDVVIWLSRTKGIALSYFGKSIEAYGTTTDKN